MLVFILCLSFNIVIGESARILAAFPVPSISHQVVFRPYIQELAKQHEVVVITTDPAFPKGQAPANLTEIDVHDISYKLWNEFYLTATGIRSDLMTQFEVAFRLIAEIFEKQIQTDEVQELLNDKNKPFDLLILEDCARPALALSYVYDVPVILFSSLGGTLGTYEIMGAAIHPLIYPLFSRQISYNLTVWQKISELYTHYSILWMYQNMEEYENKLMRRNFGPGMPTLSELGDKVQLCFLNVHPLWDANRPVPPSIVYLGGGGMHQKPEKPLPKDLKAYLDASTNGVIYMSFGTNCKASDLNMNKIQKFINVFSRLPYNIIWKWEKEELPGKSKNIKISQWLPQSDLLRHPNIKLFITQAGLQSTEEAITAGVPLIGIPMLGDQWYNAEKYEYLNIGKMLDLEQITEEMLEEAIDTVINDKSYKQNIINLRSVMHHQLEPPLVRAMWWTEHLLRHGGKHLRSPAANMSWWDFYEVDFIITLIFYCLILIALFVTGMLYLYRYIRNNYYIPNIKLKLK